MPSNSTGTISVVVPVAGQSSFAWSNADDLAACSSIPTGGTELVLPSDPSNGDQYAFADVDGSCSSSSPITILASSGTTVHGGASLALTAAFSAGILQFDAQAHAWAVIGITSGASSVGWTVSSVAGGASKNLARQPLQTMVVLGADATIGLPETPQSGDVVAITFQFNGDAGDPATTLTNQGGTAEIEQPLVPGTYGASASIVDSTSLLFYQYDSGINDWCLLASNAALATFVGALSQSPNGATTIVNFYVDGQDVSGHASNTNPAGNEALPFLNFAEVVRRWGSKTPPLNQQTFVTFLSANSTADPVDVQGTGSGNLTIQGPALSSLTPVFTGVLAGFEAFNLATGQWAALTPYAGIAVGQMVVNTTRANSRAFVLQNNEGQAVIGQPQDVSTVAGGAGEPNTAWADGDTIEAYALPEVIVTRATWDPSSFDNQGGIAFVNMNIGGLYPILGGGFSVTLCECTNTAAVNGMNLLADGAQILAYNGALTMRGGPRSSGPTQVGGIDEFVGVVMSGGGLITAFDVHTFIAAQNVTMAVSGDSAYLAVSGGLLLVSGETHAVGLGCFVGPGSSIAGEVGATLDFAGPCRCQYPNTQTAVESFTGGITLTLNGIADGLSRTTSGGTYTWFGNIALTPANLDAAAGNAGFGGLAFSTLGSACMARTTDS